MRALACTALVAALLAGCALDVGDAEPGAEELVVVPPPDLPSCPPHMELASGSCTPTPSWVGGLALWLRADRGVETTRDRRTITRWRDQSSAHRDAIAAAPGTGPIAITPGLLSPRPAVRFTPTTAWSEETADHGMLALELATLLASPAGFTMFVVARTEDRPGAVLGVDHGHAASCWNGAVPGLALGWRVRAEVTLDGSCVSTTAPIEIDAGPHVLGASVETITLPMGGATDLVAIWADDQPVGGTFTPGVRVLSSLSSEARIGRGGIGTRDSRLHGDVYEIVMFDRALSGVRSDPASEVGIVTQWLESHWGL
ncbi:hypothetical protein [Sandaracinus amylolyticus]|uniref:Uncharacterized protein n=1 Tax=Sandaracinus amylolyticus TaxID=927083 RepID=A0A0F6SFD8_9BACT|nr:hypothetical protein [Sandaracinus amylolyticus]AKF06769.1 hypothetical protein DB32_003918 [Sandaracinus amylolyticus]